MIPEKNPVDTSSHYSRPLIPETVNLPSINISVDLPVLTLHTKGACVLSLITMLTELICTSLLFTAE